MVFAKLGQEVSDVVQGEVRPFGLGQMKDGSISLHGESLSDSDGFKMKIILIYSTPPTRKNNKMGMEKKEKRVIGGRDWQPTTAVYNNGICLI